MEGASRALPVGASYGDDIGHAGRHQFPGVQARKSQFYDEVDLRTVSNTDGVDGVLQQNGNTRYVLRAADDVGVDRTTGLPTDIYTVIRGPGGSVLRDPTARPGRADVAVVVELWEGGRLVDGTEQWWDDVEAALARENEPFPLLESISPYGGTRIPRDRLTALAEECRRLSPRAGRSAEPFLLRIAALCDRAVARSDSELRVEGD